jgi:hypothetical protein
MKIQYMQYKVFDEHDNWIGPIFDSGKDAIQYAIDFGGVIVKAYTRRLVHRIQYNEYETTNIEIVWKKANVRYWKSKLSGNIYSIHEHFIPANDLYEEVTFEDWLGSFLGNA